MKALLFVLLQAYAIGTCWTRINGGLVVDQMPLWPLPIVAAEPNPPPDPPFTPVPPPTNFEATTSKQWLTLTWKAEPGTDEFMVYMKDTNNVQIVAKLTIKRAKELKKGSFDWRIERPTQVTIYSVASVVGGLVSKPSQEIRCVP